MEFHIKNKQEKRLGGQTNDDDSIKAMGKHGYDVNC